MSTPEDTRPDARWLSWVQGEVMSMTHRKSWPGACIVLAERAARPVLADPFVFSAGGMFGVIILAQEGVEARGLTDTRLTALAAVVLTDPYHLGVARCVIKARQAALDQEPFWRTL